MAVADLVQETFEDEALRGPLVDPRRSLYTPMGPWAAGTAAVFLNDSAGNDGGAPGQSTFAQGGTGALAERAREGRRESSASTIRTGAEVVADPHEERPRRRRDARRRHRDRRDGRRHGGRPEAHADTCATRSSWARTWCGARTTSAQPGATAKVNLALSGLPTFHGADDAERLKGRIVIAPSIDHVEQAMDAVKYGHLAEEPWLEATIPTLVDPSLAPEGKHVMSVLVAGRAAAPARCDWDAERERLGDIAVKTLEQYAPGLGELVEAREVITTEDFETEYGLSGGHVYHAEPGLDQFFAWRPLAGEARYQLVVDGLYLAGSGAHPGGGVTGGPGANAARADPERPRQAVARRPSVTPGRGR